MGVRVPQSGGPLHGQALGVNVGALMGLILVLVGKADEVFGCDLLDFVELFAHVMVGGHAPDAPDYLLIGPEWGKAVVAVVRAAYEDGGLQVGGDGLREERDLFLHAFLVEVEAAGLDLALDHLQAHLARLLAVLASLDPSEAVLAVDVVGTGLVVLVDRLNGHLVNTLFVVEFLAEGKTFH